MAATTYLPARNGLDDLKLKAQSVVSADQLSSYITTLAKQANLLDSHVAKLWKVIGGELPAQLTQPGMPYDFNYNIMGFETLALALATVQKDINHYEHTLAIPITEFSMPDTFAYNAEKDALIVFQNSVLLTEGVDYKILSYLALVNGTTVTRYKIGLINKLIQEYDHFDIIRIYNDFNEQTLVDNFTTTDSFNILKKKHNDLVDTLYSKGIITVDESLNLKY